MGSVFLARDEILDREVAIKFPLPDQRSDEQALRRVGGEARTAAKLHHPNLCPIHDVGEVEGVPFFVMPLLKGETLSTRLAVGPFQPTEARELVRRIALAIAHAHGLGIVHRDLKPSNIMLGPSHEPIVMDFGIARSTLDMDEMLTQSGVPIGTPHYMSPEQADGDRGAIGPRSDVYSLGVILYHLLSGRCPFEGSMGRVLGLIQHAEPPALSSLAPGIDPSLERICARAMAKSPSARFSSMEEFASAIDDAASSPRSTAVPIGVAPMSRVPPDEGRSTARPNSAVVGEDGSAVDEEEEPLLINEDAFFVDEEIQFSPVCEPASLRRPAREFKRWLGRIAELIFKLLKAFAIVLILLAGIIAGIILLIALTERHP